MLQLLFIGESHPKNTQHYENEILFRLLRMGAEIDQYYLIISSNEFDDVYPLNTNIKFDIDLPSNLQLNTSWEVALTEVWIRSEDKREQVDLCADFCIESLVNGKFIPILRRIEV